jgi:HEPN domain-containing protein
VSAAGLNSLWNSRRLWSLWDMLRVYALGYVALGREIAAVDAVFALKDAIPASDLEAEPLTAEDLAHVSGCVSAMIQTCKELDLPVSLSLLSNRANDPPRTEREMRPLVDAVYAELKGKVFLYVPPHLATYYEAVDLVSERTGSRFSCASAELREAGTALAVGLATACVFHAMRAAELGLRVLAKDLEVSFPDKSLELTDWQPIIDQVESKVRLISQKPKTLQKDEDQQFYSSAAAQFRYFKDGWRVRAMHAREEYTESEAKRVLDHVRDFFETLAERLSE